MPRRLALAAAPLVLLVASLGACAESVRIPPAEPSSATQPLFATDEEALEAATAAYEEYLRVLDDFLRTPRSVGGEFDEIAAEHALKSALSSIQQFLDDGVSITAPRRVADAALQQVISGNDSTEVVVFFCEDVSAALLIDGTGMSLTTGDRPDFTIFEGTVAFADEEAIVVDRQFWSNETSC